MSHCNLPEYFDPGATVNPRAKMYLVCGKLVEYPGAYSSWLTADQVHQQSPASTLKGYNFSERADMQAAWRASCERGDHVHPLPLRGTPLPTTTPHTHRGRTALSAAPTSLPTTQGAAPIARRRAVVVIDSRSPSPASSAAHRPRVAPTGRRAYAVRAQAAGEVFSDYAAARDHFHGLQHLGEKPVMFVGCSLTAAVSFIERGSADALAEDIEQRQQWILEELSAHSALETQADCESDCSFSEEEKPV
ncbi:hypothetical protein B0H15DRAFT_957084 [Mycena belliarum]|uniref:Uncharacterized protein n=1 Tax=Mycena belliarum TaxID=1033014 RepID=A0AAD6TQ18_9AGAR|nr:hypothetical protein B0H15DRAFT_957084 [Mycena belliae]